MGGGAAGDRIRAERSARGRAGDLRHRSQAALRRSRDLHRRVRQRSRARRRSSSTSCARTSTPATPTASRSSSTRSTTSATATSSRSIPAGAKWDSQMSNEGRDQNAELGRHLGRRHAHRRRRLVCGDRDSVQDAEVRTRGDADLGHQLPAPAAPQERKQLLVAAAAHPPAVARVDGRHLRRPAGPEARRQRPRQAVRARQPQQGRRACRSTRTTTPAST